MVEAAELGVEEEHSDATTALLASRRAPDDLVREFLSAPHTSTRMMPPRETTDEEVTAVVVALKAAQVQPSTWVDELQEMVSECDDPLQVLEEHFLPACMKKLQQQTQTPEATLQQG